MPHVCPGCGNRLAENGCKLRCTTCGYFEDCGDGMVPAPNVPEAHVAGAADASPAAAVSPRPLFE